MKDADLSLFLLFQIGVSLHQLNKRLEKHLGLSLVQWCLLKNLIDLPAVSALSLATAVGVHPSTLTQTLKRLEKKKFIFVMEDSTDSRKKLISITRAGKNNLESTSKKMKKKLSTLFEFEKELATLQTVLKTQSHF